MQSGAHTLLIEVVYAPCLLLLARNDVLISFNITL